MNSTPKFATSNALTDPNVATQQMSAAGYALKLFAALALIIVVLPYFFYPPFVMQVLCYGIFAAAVGLLLSYGGLLSFGHAAFFGVAGYVSAYSTKVWALPTLAGIGMGVAAALVLGAVIGILAIRRQGIYFSMVTLAFAQMVYFFCLRAGFTGAEDGIQSVPRGYVFGQSLSDGLILYALVAGMFFLAMLFIYRVVHSPFGEILVAIREHEPRAISLGYRTTRFKLALFVITAGLAGLAGATKTVVTQLASLSDVHWMMSADAVLMTVLGGQSSIFGPVVGAAVILYIKVNMAWAGAWVTVIQGGIFVFCVLAFRKGIIGIFKRWIRT